VKFDVKDFYLTGDASFLSHCAAQFAIEGLAETVKHAVRFILEHQFVSLDGELWQCAIGFGMGFRFSGEIADMAFDTEMEQPGPLNHAFRSMYNLLFYGRYRDDVFMLLTDGSSFSNLARALKQLCMNFRLEQWEISLHSLVHLDCVVYKMEGVSSLNVRPHFKPTSLGVPLHPKSTHPLHIHVAWMRSAIERMSRLSSSYSAFFEAKTVLLSKLSRWIPIDIIDS
jgi:hypothetical protein